VDFSIDFGFTIVVINMVKVVDIAFVSIFIFSDQEIDFVIDLERTLMVSFKVKACNTMIKVILVVGSSY